MQQLYAKIKKTSDYYGQNQTELIDGKLQIIPFPVEIVIEGLGISRGYHVQGGICGQYRLKDVDLYVLQDGKELKIS